MYIMNGTQDDGPSADILDHYHWYQFVGLCLAPATEDGAGDAAAAVVDAPTSRAGVDVVHVHVGAPTRRHDVLCFTVTAFDSPYSTIRNQMNK